MHRIWILVVIGQMALIAIDFQEWPLTQAPLFSRYRSVSEVAVLRPAVKAQDSSYIFIDDLDKFTLSYSFQEEWLRGSTELLRNELMKAYQIHKAKAGSSYAKGPMVMVVRRPGIPDREVLRVEPLR